MHGNATDFYFFLRFGCDSLLILALWGSVPVASLGLSTRINQPILQEQLFTPLWQLEAKLIVFVLFIRNMACSLGGSAECVV